MKTKKLLLVLFLMIAALFFSACKANKDMEAYDGGEGGWVEPGGYGTYKGDSEHSTEVMPGEYGYTTIEGKDDGSSTTSTNNLPRSGQLTVKAYNDNENWDYYKSLITKGQEKDGEFKRYQDKYNLANNRVKLSFKGVSNIKVTLLNDESEAEFIAYSDATGNVYLFNNTERDTYKVRIEYNRDGNNINEVKEVKDNDEIDLGVQNQKNNIIQLMFVIDTTGSMGDEIAYIQAEIIDIIRRVKEDNNQITIYLALMFYRDNGDDYVTRYYDFSTDIEAQVAKLAKEFANGGGDFEEAVDEAFKLASLQQWLLSSSTNILIHVADAPSHDKDVVTWFKAVEKLAACNVKVINVASSGINKATEYLFRNECLQTNGYYCYLTNHSGIGNGHIEATVGDEPTVEFLNDCLVRLINGIHTGEMQSPTEYTQQQ